MDHQDRDDAAAAPQASDAAAVSDAAYDAAQSFQPDGGVVIHISPLSTTRPRLEVQVRLGNGPDAPIVRLPASVWFGPDGRLKAVATPMTASEADDLEFEDKSDDDESIVIDDDNEEPAANDSNSPINGNVDDDDDDDEVLFLGEFRNGGAQA